MKENGHPNYHEVDVVCACGNTFKTGSTAEGDVIKIDICNKCHPFFTGKQKIVDTSGRVEKFNKKFNR
ncbi:MAG: 50S ribosomal protein L31 [Firmicutes bacterium]|nr:50S ribosomal protein L31 [Bacillota bacterium]